MTPVICGREPDDVDVAVAVELDVAIDSDDADEDPELEDCASTRLANTNTQ